MCDCSCNAIAQCIFQMGTTINEAQMIIIEYASFYGITDIIIEHADSRHLFRTGFKCTFLLCQGRWATVPAFSVKVDIRTYFF